MTAEQLYSKSEIAMELGFRDMRIEELLSAVKQLREDRQWQPIETAPRDGRPILLMKNGELFTARYIDGEYGHGWCTPDGNEIFHPTYWMPSPDVPQDFINERIEKERR